MYVDSTLGLDSAPDSRLDNSLAASLWIAPPGVTLAGSALSPQMGAGGCKNHLGGTLTHQVGPPSGVVIVYDSDLPARDSERGHQAIHSLQSGIRQSRRQEASLSVMIEEGFLTPLLEVQCTKLKHAQHSLFA